MKDRAAATAYSAASDTECLSQAQSLIKGGRFAEAVSLLTAMTQRTTADAVSTDAWYMLAVASRYAKDFNTALNTLEGLLIKQPDYGRAYQEQGYNYLALNRVNDAARSFEQAVDHNPALVASWKALTGLYKIGNNQHRLKQAGEQLAYLDSLPSDLVAVIDLMHEGRIYKAERLCRDFLVRHKHHIEAMRLLAEIGVSLKIYDDAEFLLESCIEFAPDNIRARTDYLNLLNRKGKFQKAAEQAAFMLEEQVDNLQLRTLLANALAGLGRMDEAITLYQFVLERTVNKPGIQLMLGHAHKASGEFEKAVNAYSTAYAARPDFGDAYWSLANTKTYRFADAEIDQIKMWIREPATATEDRIHMCFALGKAYEDSKEYASSFEYYQQGNMLKKNTNGYSADINEQMVEAQIQACTVDLFDCDTVRGCESPDPIFIVGLPRAGSTLLEQILASHSQVDATMELHNILGLAQRLRGRDSVKSSRYPGILHELDADYFRRFGEQFINDTRAYRGKAAYFIDKMPNNFMHIGLIHLILPRARVIDARREPMACGFSNYKQLFGEGQEFSYNLEDIGRYYNSYVRLMSHWDHVLPGKVLRVMHEDIVEDLETELRRILDFLELPFESQCLEYYRTERSIRTPSSEQVRQPIFRSGLEQWKHYEAWLGPLKQSLANSSGQSA